MQVYNLTMIKRYHELVTCRTSLWRCAVLSGKPKEGASTANQGMTCLVYLAVNRCSCTGVHNLDCEGDAAGLQLLTQQPLRRARGDEDCAGVQVLDLQALVP